MKMIRHSLVLLVFCLLLDSCGNNTISLPQPALCRTDNVGVRSACYDGVDTDLRSGVCKRGKAICLSEGRWSACQEQVLPKIEPCAAKRDLNCNGYIGESCRRKCSFLYDFTTFEGNESGDYSFAFSFPKENHISIKSLRTKSEFLFDLRNKKIRGKREVDGYEFSDDSDLLLRLKSSTVLDTKSQEVYRFGKLGLEHRYYQRSFDFRRGYFTFLNQNRVLEVYSLKGEKKLLHKVSMKNEAMLRNVFLAPSRGKLVVYTQKLGTFKLTPEPVLTEHDAFVHVFDLKSGKKIHTHQFRSLRQFSVFEASSVDIQPHRSLMAVGRESIGIVIINYSSGDTFFIGNERGKFHGHPVRFHPGGQYLLFASHDLFGLDLESKKVVSFFQSEGKGRRMSGGKLIVSRDGKYIADHQTVLKCESAE